MMNRKQILSTMAAMAVLLSSQGVAFASTDTPEKGTPITREIHREAKVLEAEKTKIMEARKASLEKAVNKLLEEGTLSQEEADKLLNPVESDHMEFHLSEGVSFKVANQGDEETDLKGEGDHFVFGPIGEHEGKEFNLDGMKVIREGEDGGISITLAVQPSEGEQIEWNGEMAKEAKGIFHVSVIDFLTEEQSTALREEMQTQFELILQDLVDQGEITQEEADQCKERDQLMQKNKHSMRTIKLEKAETEEDAS